MFARARKPGAGVTLPPMSKSTVSEPRPFNWDKVTALVAVLIGACALVVSLYTAQLQRSQVQAQTWPFLQLWQSDSGRTFSISNRGVGPARILDVQVRADGKEVSSFAEAFQVLVGRSPTALQTSYFSRRVLAANEDVRMASFGSDGDYRAFFAQRGRLSIQVCYCSLLGECTLLDETATTDAEALRPVARCPQGPRGQFR